MQDVVKVAEGIDSMQEIVKVSTECGWIGAVELLNLELTCKKARTAVSTEEVWEELCLRTWPNTDLLSSFIETKRGYRAWYKLRTAKPTSSVHVEPLPPPSLRPEGLFFLIDIKVGDDIIISTAKSGDSLGFGIEDSMVSRHGHIALLISSFGTTCKGVQYELGDTNEILSTDDFTSKVLTVELQMVTDTHTCKVMMENDRYFFERLAVEESHGKRNEIRPSIVGDTNDAHQIQSSLLGSAIQQRLGNPFSLRLFPIARFTDDGKKIVVDAMALQFRVGESFFDKELQDKTGVSILHVLEQLELSPLST